MTILDAFTGWPELITFLKIVNALSRPGNIFCEVEIKSNKSAREFTNQLKLSEACFLFVAY